MSTHYYWKIDNDNERRINKTDFFLKQIEFAEYSTKVELYEDEEMPTRFDEQHLVLVRKNDINSQLDLPHYKNYLDVLSKYEKFTIDDLSKHIGLKNILHPDRQGKKEHLHLFFNEQDEWIGCVRYGDNRVDSIIEAIKKVFSPIQIYDEYEIEWDEDFNDWKVA